MKRITTILVAAALVAACSDDTNTGAATGDTVADTTDASPDGAGDSTEGDATPEVEEDTGPDATQVVADEPKAWVYEHDPVTDGEQPVQVVLTKPITEDGRLKSEYVDVRNCLNEEGGEEMKLQGFTLGHLCHEVQTVVPDADGHYLSYQPGKNYGDPNDSWPELNMYHHVNQMHDFFAVEHGLSDLDFPLQAIVNLQFDVDQSVAGLVGMQPGWNPFPNAAFIPEEQFQQFLLPPRDNGAIVFGQDVNTDFAFDASVIYHEYTHAMVGSTRLIGLVPHPNGVEDLLAMNEGFADYFAASFSDNPKIGSYGIANLQPNLLRDLTDKHVCPSDLVGEAHADGKVIGSAMWAVRQAIGADVADGIILKAVQGFTAQTTMELAGQAILAEAALIDATTADTVQAIFEDYGILGCERAREWSEFNALTSPEGVPYIIPGTAQTQNPAYSQWAPGYFQFYVDVPANTTGIQLTWSAQSGGFLGGPSIADLDIAVRKGQPVEIDVSGGSAVATADAEIDVPLVQGEQSQKVTLLGQCLPAEGERVFIMFRNAAQGGAQIATMSVKFLADAGAGANPNACE